MDQYIDDSLPEIKHLIKSLFDKMNAIFTNSSNLSRKSAAEIFKAPFEKIFKLLNSSQVNQLIEKDRFLSIMYQQLQIMVNHLDLEFDKIHPEFPHEPVFTGPFPLKASRNALKVLQNFIFALTGTEETALLVTETPEKIETKIQELYQKESVLIESITLDPLKFYLSFKERIFLEGLSAKFFEFAGLIEYLELTLKQTPIVSVALRHRSFAIMRARILNELQSIQKLEYPYYDTLDAIENCLGFFDIFERAKSQNNFISKLFHSIRYRYYSEFLKEEAPHYFLIPTFYNVGATEILKIKGAPLAFLGVHTKPHWADGYFQSPLEFWFHDINHTRRMWQFVKERAATLGISTEAFFFKSHRYVSECLIPLISLKNNERIEIENRKKIIKIILFEILHEDALPGDEATITEALIRPPLKLTPVESIIKNKVQYLMVDCAPTLAFVYWKLNYCFFDAPELRMNCIVDKDYRTVQDIVEAALFLTEQLNLLGIDQSILWKYTYYGKEEKVWNTSYV